VTSDSGIVTADSGKAPKSVTFARNERSRSNGMTGHDAGITGHVGPEYPVYNAEERRWRLAPAFDVVPNPVETPVRLNMQLSQGRFDISRDAVLADAHRFGFTSATEATTTLDDLLARITAGFDEVAHWLDQDWKNVLHERLSHNVVVLSGRQGLNQIFGQA
jgi:serine/threonine-protein kinase HipA